MEWPSNCSFKSDNFSQRNIDLKLRFRINSNELDNLKLGRPKVSILEYFAEKNWSEILIRWLPAFFFSYITFYKVLFVTLLVYFLDQMTSNQSHI